MPPATHRTHDFGEPPVRLAAVVGSLSLIIDLGLGQALEHALRSAVIAVRLGAVVGLDHTELADAYYVALLRFVGCTAAAHEMAEVLGDEIAARAWLTPVFTGRLDEMPAAVRRNVGLDAPPARREQLQAEVMAGLKQLHGTGAAQCEVAQLLAAQLGLGPSVQAALGQVFERWDGFGVPRGLKGDQIRLAVQVAQLAQNAELFHRQGGVRAAVDTIRSRAASAHAPALVDSFCAHAPAILDEPLDRSVWEQALADEPGPPRWLRGAEIDRAASAFADFADLKSAYTVGHSRGVARLAAAASASAGLPPLEVAAVTRAALVHDVGRAGVPARIWDKAGPLAASEWERVRLHVYYTERALARCGVPGVGSLASQHHERLDGSGYFRGATAGQLTLPARILAAADSFHAMLEPRPHRPPLSAAYAAAELRREARAGKLDAEAVGAVLTAAGQQHGAGRQHHFAGLTGREREVLGLLARGCSVRHIAEQLIITERTAHHHVEHIYAKLGVSTRAAATVAALQHGLVADALDDPDATPTMGRTAHASEPRPGARWAPSPEREA